MPAGWAKFGRAAGWGIVLGLAAGTAAEAASIFLGRNWHVVIPGQAYRSAQLSYDQLGDAVHQYGIHTVVNLRGTSPDFDWYLGESRATCDADVGQEDITLSAYRLPAPDELRRLVDVIDHAEYPLLFHCRQGVDRTGLAASVLLLLRTDATPAEARRQLGLRFGHIPIGPTACMLQFMDLYESWLQRVGRPHSPDALREWADHGYCPSYLRGRLELIEPPNGPKVGSPAAIRIRAINTSPEPWHFHPGTETGVHVRFLVFDPNWKLVQIGRAGQFEATVPPGESLDLTLALNPPANPGRYLVTADLADSNRFSFSQFGSQPLELAVSVGGAAP
jgi:protein tyrosine/serine phosphatase